MSVFESLLNHSFFAVRKNRVSDGQGGWFEYWDQLDPVDGRLRPATSREREVGSQEQRVITHVFYTVAGEDLSRGDMVSPGVILIDGLNLSASDLIVEIDGIREPSTSDEHWEIDCVEYQFERSVSDGS